MTAQETSPKTPLYDRQALLIHSSGNLAEIFGPLFEKQSAYAVQIRLPEPPLLLVDRIIALEGEAGSQSKGAIWTEAEVQTDSWYLHHGRMPAGLFVESGQADLFLISWLGADFINQGERAYRLLGCELTYYGELPKPGDVLRYHITITGYAR
jgi:3-hydroxymyristoyl/3-hydroxydecanoyl-(acyl carrier protein) dehydratase